MSFSFRPAVRERVSLLMAYAGPSGSGKTLSALKTARGLAGGDDRKIFFIDTEAGRGRHYAPPPGGQPGPSSFSFTHGDLTPPFTPKAYMAAIVAAEASGAEVIVIDSASHVWDGDGGVQDMHAAILDAQVAKARQSHNASWPFDEDKTRDRLSVGAWKEPKGEHKRLVSRLLQCRAHLIFCLRADEKMRMDKVKDDRGRERTVITQAKDLPPAERWQPICEKRFPYEMTVSLVLTPQAPGIPVPVKLQEQHRTAFPLDRPISEETGRLLAIWACGGHETGAPGGAPKEAGASSAIPEVPASLLQDAEAAAVTSTAALESFWKGLKRGQQRALLPEMTRLKAVAGEADRAWAEAEATEKERAIA